MTIGGMLPINAMPVETWRGCKTKDSCGDGAESLFSIKAFIDQLVKRDSTNNSSAYNGKSFSQTKETRNLNGSETAEFPGKKISSSSENYRGAKSLYVSDSDVNGYLWKGYN